MITKFETGTDYTMRSVCDYDCVWTYRVTRRTAKSVWLQQVNSNGPLGEVERKAIKEWRGSETCKPLGNYSMAPILNADSPVLEAA